MYHISMYLGLNGYTKDYTLLPTFCTCKSNVCDFLSDMHDCTKFLKKKLTVLNMFWQLPNIVEDFQRCSDKF